MAEKVKHYTPREERLNAASHLAGILFGVIGIFPLYHLAAVKNDGAFSASLIFYLLAFLAMFGASSFYHLCQDPWRKTLARKFDHCAIYLLITGTYAPLITGAVKNTAGYIVLLALCVLTLLGIFGKFLVGNKFHYLEVVIYLAMGWACVFIAPALIETMTRNGLLLLLYGGTAYTGGVVFYAVHKEFFHAIWHFFVLAGAIFQFFALLTL